MNATKKTAFDYQSLKSILRLAPGVDWWLVAATGFLLLVGLTTLKHSSPVGDFYQKQLEFVWIGLAGFFVFWRIPYFFWTQKNVALVLYIINIGLLLTVLLWGHAALGAQRWLILGPLRLQPSEVAKIIVIFTLSAYLREKPIRSFLDNFKVLALIALPAFLVFRQPDLGTSLTFAAIFLGMSFWAGATVNDLLVLLSPGVSIILNAVNPGLWLGYIVTFGGWLALFWRRANWTWPVRILMASAVVAVSLGAGEARPHLWGLLKQYQQKRLTSFVNPYEDPRGSGYHILQSLIAIGSGGIFGSGLGHGHQSQGAFIPERHTDFIFAVIGEELGFKIAALVIIAYAIICLRALKIAWQAREQPAGSLMAIGIMSLFLFHVFLNIGMTMGIMPVAGVPLPFLSYGGTALVVDFIAVGLLQSIRFANPPPRPDIWR